MNKIYEKFGKPTSWLKKVLMRRQKGLCNGCGINEWELDRNFQIHRHIKDGPYHPDNTELLCFSCHTKYHTIERRVANHLRVE